MLLLVPWLSVVYSCFPCASCSVSFVSCPVSFCCSPVHLFGILCPVLGALFCTLFYLVLRLLFCLLSYARCSALFALFVCILVVAYCAVLLVLVLIVHRVANGRDFALD